MTDQNLTPSSTDSRSTENSAASTDSTLTAHGTFTAQVACADNSALVNPALSNLASANPDLAKQVQATPAQEPQERKERLTLDSPVLKELFASNLEKIKRFRQGRQDMTEHLGIEFTKCEIGYMEATMPVDERTCRMCYPVNILNGGASIALAETMAGLGSLLLCRPHFHPCGIQVSANHLHMLSEGHTVTAIGRLQHFGSTLHVWEINILDERQRTISSIRITNMIVAEKAPS